MNLKTWALVGLEAREASIHVSIDEGPRGYGFRVEGSFPESEKPIPEHALRESKVRVQAALSNMGLYFEGHVDVRLPEGARLIELDLAIALACLEAAGKVELPPGVLARAELNLDGTLRALPGCFALLSAAPRASVAVVARHNRSEAEASGQPFIAHQSLADVASAFPPRKIEAYDPMPARIDFRPKEWGDEAAAKIEAAAKEGRDVLLLGLPGSGTMMTTRYYHSFLTLTLEQAIEVMKVQSAGCVLDEDRFRVPYRAPHHSVSAQGMTGGASGFLGEVTLAHHGVLVLDELAEFRRSVLEDVRQIHKSGRTGSYPASFRIVATASPCPLQCRGACKCEGAQLERYRERLALVGELEAIRLP